ncbi:uncharacterized protein BHQ10_007734 [Talaromyces amestolkiae]|uniref:Uncharacterized protein n=1 Tax=Talaromyces amestolkiae TaxID=1196081 RepID=A0A364L7E3_TALAM|nr:uncharacterized protein BHQ10_007734 [Talaromyces amestolkiae]RAO71722.1 hypothetical protein BHQ10_007734 [Talaromyces amestolkiae]
MAHQLQPDRAHDAEENSSQYYSELLGLIDQEFSELPNIDATQELLLRTPYQNDDHDRFENTPNLSPPRGPVEFPTQNAAEAAYINPRLYHEQIDDQVPSLTSISDPRDPIRVTNVADNAFAPTERQTTVEATYWQQIREFVLSGLIPGPTPQNEERRGRKCLKCRFEKGKVVRSYNAE